RVHGPRTFQCAHAGTGTHQRRGADAPTHFRANPAQGTDCLALKYPHSTKDNSMKHPSSQRVVVIGGGFSGLASAGLLAASGHRVTLLEQQHTLGGRAGRLERDGFSFDTGPSW